MRFCCICKEHKHDMAFVGKREICRNCWGSLSEDEKRLNILWPRDFKEYKSNKDADKD